MSPSLLTYELRQQVVSIGPYTLHIEAIRDMNKTIDDLFALLEQDGTPDLLEKLCPYFGVIWPAARALAHHLAQVPIEEIRGKKLLEVGCGLALPSLIAALRGAEVTATDFHPEVPKFLARNIKLNSGQGSISKLRYIESDWMSEFKLDESKSPGSPLADLGPFDWIIGSDILYEKTYPGPVARALTRHAIGLPFSSPSEHEMNRISAGAALKNPAPPSSRPGTRIVLADPGRPYLQPFVDEMKKTGFDAETRILPAEGITEESGQPKEVFMLLFSFPSSVAR